MTPLAAYLAKQTVARPKHREGIWRDPEIIGAMRVILEDIHCFEITGAMPLVIDTQRRLAASSEDNRDHLFSTFGFLPAPKTWIEWKPLNTSSRLAVLIEECGPGYESTDGSIIDDLARVALFEREALNLIGWVQPSTGRFLNSSEEKRWPAIIRAKPKQDDEGAAAGLFALCHIALILINSPKIIGRRQHMPNVGLERRLTRGFGVGKFPLHAWTEIMLEVNKPPEIDDGEPHEAHLTGRRALHFCRKHIRIRNGQLEYVRAHWRGDPALGIKRSRYTVVPAGGRHD